MGMNKAYSIKFVSFAVLSSFSMSVLAVGNAYTGAVSASSSEKLTAGWRNVNPNRQELASAKLYWESAFELGESAFVVEMCGGAKGDVSFNGGAMTIRKTNEQGWIAVRSRESISAGIGQKLRSFADAEVYGADPFNSVAFLRLLGRDRSLVASWELDVKGIFMLGGPKMGLLANTAPEQTERRFASMRVTELSGTNLTPVLVIAGAPSTSVWKRWGVEDHDAAVKKWRKYVAEHQGVEGRLSKGVTAAEYFKRLECDIDHTAKVLRGEDETRIVVDGRLDVPVLYKPNHCRTGKWYRSTGSFLSQEGIRLQAFLIDARNCFASKGFEAGIEDGLDNALEQMRRAPDALFIVSLNLNVPREWTASHPDDVWQNPDGTAVYGNYDKIRNWADGKPPLGCWPWPSLYSDVWQSDINRFLDAIVDGLKRRGLSKRIVGFHICGYHDGQFAPYKPDYSRHAIRSFCRWLEKRGVAVPDSPPVCTIADDFFAASPDGALKREMQIFHHVGPFRVQEGFARRLKKAFGKDVLALHWSMDVLDSANSGSFYLGEFMKSDVMDGLVSQSSYVYRSPALALGEAFPAASFTKNGKLYIDEFDLRSYGLIARYVANEVSLRGLAHARDFVEWQSVHHRIAGIGIARRQGWWYYEISGGFFEPPEIAADIGEVKRFRAEMSARKDLPSWSPAAAFVIDEKGLLDRNFMSGSRGGDRSLVVEQSNLMAASGVPYDVWLAEDAMAESSVLLKRNVVVIAGFYNLEGRRADFVKSLLETGRTVVLLAGSGAAGGADEFDFETVMRPMPADHEVESLTGDSADFRSIFHSKWMRWTLGEKSGSFAEIWRPSCFGLKGKSSFTPVARYVKDQLPSAIERRYGNGRLVVLGEPAGLSPVFFNKLVVDAGGYVPVKGGGKLQVDMNAGFVSVHALDAVDADFKLPFSCRVLNVKNGREEIVANGAFRLLMEAGQTSWFKLFVPEKESR